MTLALTLSTLLSNQGKFLQNTNLAYSENDSVITQNLTINTGKNAVSAGPLTINSGAVVTINSGSTWVVVN